MNFNCWIFFVKMNWPEYDGFNCSIQLQSDHDDRLIVEDDQFIDNGSWVTTIFFLALTLILQLMSTGLCCFNVWKNPIEWWQGPTGIYGLNAISGAPTSLSGFQQLSYLFGLQCCATWCTWLSGAVFIHKSFPPRSQSGKHCKVNGYRRRPIWDILTGNTSVSGIIWVVNRQLLPAKFG